MAVYIAVITFVLFFQLPLFKKRNDNKILLYLILFLLFISGMRGNGSGDYFNYLAYSKLITSFSDVLNNSFPMEIGFRVLSYSVNVLHLNSQWVIMIMNLISLVFIYKFIKTYSNDYRFSVFLFLPIFFMFDMHAARTAVAISIGTYGFKYILDRNFFKFLIVVLFAMCFHKVAIVLLFLYFLTFIKRSSFFYIGTIPLAIFISFFNFYKLLYSFFLKLQFTNLAEKVFSYNDNNRFGYSFSLLDPRLLLSIIILIVSIIIIEKYKVKYNEREDLYIMRLLLKINWLLIITMIIFSSNTIFVIRIYGFYCIYSIIQIPMFMEKYKELTNKKSFIFMKLMIISVYILYLFFILRDYPIYRFFFQN